MKYIVVLIAAFITVKCMPRPNPDFDVPLLGASEGIPAGLNGHDNIQPDIDIGDNGQVSISEKQSTYQEKNDESSNHEAKSSAYSDGKGNSASHSKESETTHSENEKEKKTDTKTLTLGTDGLSSTHETDTTQERNTSDTARGSESFNQQTGDGQDHVHKHSSGSEYSNSSQTHDKSNKKTKDTVFLGPNLETKKEHQESKTNEHGEKQTARGSSYENREDHDKDGGRVQNGVSKSQNSYNNEAAKSSSNSSVSNTQENSNGENSNGSDVNVERGGDLGDSIGIRQDSDSNADKELEDKTNKDTNIAAEGKNTEGSQSDQQKDMASQTDVVADAATQSVSAIGTGSNGSDDQQQEQANTETEVNTNTRGEESTQGDTGNIVLGTNGVKGQEKQDGTQGGSASVGGVKNGDLEQEQKVSAETGGETKVSNEADNKFEIGSDMKFGSENKGRGKKGNHRVKTGKIVFHKDVLRQLDRDERALGLARDVRSTSSSSESMEKSHSAIDVSKLRKEYLLSVAQNIHNSKIVSDGHGHARIVSPHHHSKHHSHHNLAQRYGVSPVGSHYANVQYVEERFGNLSSLINAGNIFAKFHAKTQTTDTGKLQNGVKNVFHENSKRPHRTDHSLANLHLSPSEWQELFEKEVEQKNAEHNGIHRSRGTGYARVFKLDPIVKDAIISRNLDDELKSPHKRKFSTTMISVSKEKEHNMIPNRKIRHFSTKKQRIVIHPKSKADDITINRNTGTFNHTTISDSVYNNIIPPKPNFEVSSKSSDATKDLMSLTKDDNTGSTRRKLETKTSSKQIDKNTLDSSVDTNPARSNRVKNNQKYEITDLSEHSVPLETFDKENVTESYKSENASDPFKSVKLHTDSIKFSDTNSSWEANKNSFDTKESVVSTDTEYNNATKIENIASTTELSTLQIDANKLSLQTDTSINSTSNQVLTKSSPINDEVRNFEFNKTVSEYTSNNTNESEFGSKVLVQNNNLNTNNITKISVNKNDYSMIQEPSLETAKDSKHLSLTNNSILISEGSNINLIDYNVSQYNNLTNKLDLSEEITTKVAEKTTSATYDESYVSESPTVDNLADIKASNNSSSQGDTKQMLKRFVELDHKFDETVLHNQYSNKSDSKTDSPVVKYNTTKVVEKNGSEIYDSLNVIKYAASNINRSDKNTPAYNISQVPTDVIKQSVEYDLKKDEIISHNEDINNSSDKTYIPEINLNNTKAVEQYESDIYDKTNVDEFPTSIGNVSDMIAPVNSNSTVETTEISNHSVGPVQKVDGSILNNKDFNNSSNLTYTPDINLNNTKAVEQYESDIYDKTNVDEFPTSIGNVSDMIAPVNSNSTVETTEMSNHSVGPDQKVDGSILNNEDLNNFGILPYTPEINLNNTKAVEQNESGIYDKTNVSEFATSIGNTSNMIAPVNSNSTAETTEMSNHYVGPDQKVDESILNNKDLNNSSNLTFTPEINLNNTKAVELNESDIYDKTNVDEFPMSIGNVSDMIAPVNSNSTVETTEMSNHSVGPDQEVDESFLNNKDLNNSSNLTYTPEINVNNTKAVEQDKSDIYDKTNVAEYSTIIGNVSDMIAPVNSNSTVETTEMLNHSVGPDQKVDGSILNNEDLNNSSILTYTPEINLNNTKAVEQNESDIYDKTNVAEFPTSIGNVSDMIASVNSNSTVEPPETLKPSAGPDQKVDESILNNEDLNNSSILTYTPEINLNNTKAVEQNESDIYDKTNFAEFPTSIGNVSDMIASVNSNSTLEPPDTLKPSAGPDQKVDESILNNEDLNNSKNLTYLPEINLNNTRAVEQNESDIYDKTNFAEFPTSIGNVSDMIASVNSNSTLEPPETLKPFAGPDQKVDESILNNEDLNISSNKTYIPEINSNTSKIVEQNESDIYNKTNVADFATSIGTVPDTIASVNSDSTVETTEMLKLSVGPDQKVGESISHNIDLNNSDNITYLYEVNLNTTKVVEQNKSDIYDKPPVAEFATNIGNMSDMIESVNSNSTVETTKLLKRSVEPDLEIDETVTYNHYLNKSDNKTYLPERKLNATYISGTNGSEILQNVDLNKFSNETDLSKINLNTVEVLRKNEHNHYNTSNSYHDKAYDDKAEFSKINLDTTEVVDKNETKINTKVVEPGASVINTTETNLSNKISYAETIELFENFNDINSKKINKRNINDIESSSDSETVTIQPNLNGINKNVTEIPLNMSDVIDKPIHDALFQLSNSVNGTIPVGDFGRSNMSDILNKKNNSDVNLNSTNLHTISSTTTRTPVIFSETVVSENSITDSGKTERFARSSEKYNEAHKYENTNSTSNATNNTSYNSTETSISKISLDSNAFDMDHITSISETGITNQIDNRTVVSESNINDTEKKDTTIIGDKNQTVDSTVTVKEKLNEAKNLTAYTNIETTSKLDTNKTESLSNEIMGNITPTSENNNPNNSNPIVLSDANANVTSIQPKLNETDVTVNEIATANSSNTDNKLLDIDNSIKQTSKRDLKLAEEPTTEAKDTGNFDYTASSRVNFTSTAVVDSDNYTTTDRRLGDNNKTDKLVTVITSEKPLPPESEKILPIVKSVDSTPTVKPGNRSKAKTNKLTKTVKSDKKNEIPKSDKDDSISKSEESSSRSSERLIYASNIVSVNTDDSSSSSFESLVR